MTERDDRKAGQMNSGPDKTGQIPLLRAHTGNRLSEGAYPANQARRLASDAPAAQPAARC